MFLVGIRLGVRRVMAQILTFLIGKRKKTAEDRIAAARAKGVLTLEESRATDKLVLCEVEKGTKKNYNMMMDL